MDRSVKQVEKETEEVLHELFDVFRRMDIDLRTDKILQLEPMTATAVRNRTSFFLSTNIKI